jgi:hypothetical protein
MRHIPRSSRIFIGILVITLLVTYLALHFSLYVANQTLRDAPAIPEAKTEQAIQQPPVDTTDWQTYTDKKYPLTFLYPKSWTVKAAVNKQKFYDITLNPGAKYPDMHIYVSTDGYYALDGLKQTPAKIGGQTAFTVSENLYGIKVGEAYYTFDGSLNTTQVPEFTALLKTVKFQ